MRAAIGRVNRDMHTTNKWMQCITSDTLCTMIEIQCSMHIRRRETEYVSYCRLTCSPTALEFPLPSSSYAHDMWSHTCARLQGTRIESRVPKSNSRRICVATYGCRLNFKRILKGCCCSPDAAAAAVPLIVKCDPIQQMEMTVPASSVSTHRRMPMPILASTLFRELPTVIMALALIDPEIYSTYNVILSIRWIHMKDIVCAHNWMATSTKTYHVTTVTCNSCL